MTTKLLRSGLYKKKKKKIRLQHLKRWIRTFSWKNHMHWWVWVCVHDSDNEQTFRSWPHRSSNHLDKWSRRRTLCSTHVSNCTGHRHYIIAFENSTNSAYITMVLGQPAGLSTEVFVYRGWLDKALQSQGGQRWNACKPLLACIGRFRRGS